MVTSIRKILEENNLRLDDTVYTHFNKDLLDYKFNMPALFEVYDVMQALQDLSCEQTINEALEALHASLEFIQLQIQTELQPAASLDPEEKRALRKAQAERRELIKEKEQAERQRVFEKMYGTPSPKTISYKSVFTLTDLSDLQAKIPQLKAWDGHFAACAPLFVRNMDFDPDSIAIEGGPCLFGADEMGILVTEQDGKTSTFDFIRGFNYDNYGFYQNIFLDYIAQNGEKVESITFTCQKDRLTFDEFHHLDTQFSLAKALNCPMVATITDMSYIKYLDEILYYLDETVGRNAIANFTEQAYLISDLYIREIEVLQEKYQLEQLAVVHSRNEEAMRTFYEQREPFTQKMKVRAKSEKLQSVTDYVTMPALPFYLWGKTDILEFNSMLETESVIKCGRIHKNTIHLHSIFFPHEISSDGANTGYFAAREHKKYI